MDSTAHQLERFRAQDRQRRGTPMSFLDLPFELRLKIYRFYVPRGCFVWNKASSTIPEFHFVLLENRARLTPRTFSQEPFETALLRVCKQVSEECLDVLYGENQFEMNLARGAQVVLQKAFTSQNIQRIRQLNVIARLTAHPPDVRLLPQPDHQFWSVVIPQLRNFILQANDPAICVNATLALWDTDRVIERRLLDNWKERAEPYFELFGRLLGGVTRNIQVEITVGSETLRIAQQHIPGRFPVKVVDRVQCICGKMCTK